MGGREIAGGKEEGFNEITFISRGASLLSRCTYRSFLVNVLVIAAIRSERSLLGRARFWPGAIFQRAVGARSTRLRHASSILIRRAIAATLSVSLSARENGAPELLRWSAARTRNALSVIQRARAHPPAAEYRGNLLFITFRRFFHAAISTHTGNRDKLVIARYLSFRVLHRAA